MLRCQPGMKVRLGYWAGLPLRGAGQALEEVEHTGRGALAPDGIQAEVFEHAVALMIR